MKVQDGYDAPGRHVTRVTPVSLPQNGAWVPRPWCTGADRAWWSDWSSKPAGVRMDLGRFDSYTLPPRAVPFVSHPRDTAATNLPQSRSPSRRPFAASRGITLAIEYVGSRGVSRAPAFAQL